MQHPSRGWANGGLKRLSRGPACEAQADSKQKGGGDSCAATLHPRPERAPGDSLAWREGIASYLVCVPQADGAAKGKLPHKQVVHPTKGKL